MRVRASVLETSFPGSRSVVAQKVCSGGGVSAGIRVMDVVHMPSGITRFTIADGTSKAAGNVVLNIRSPCAGRAHGPGPL